MKNDAADRPVTGPSINPGKGLRQRAEAAFRERAIALPESLTPDAARKLVYELQVHHIQLEMQNEELRGAQAELDAVRARYFDLYNLAPVGYITLSGNGLIVEANLMVAGLLGVARSVLVNQPLFRFIFREDQDLYYLNQRRLKESCFTSSGQAGAAQSYELRMVKLDGTQFWAQLEVSAIPLPVPPGSPDQDGSLLCRIVLNDITARKLQEEALREREHSLQEVQRIANLGSYVLDIPSGIWTSSDVMDQVFGIDKTYGRTVEGWAALIHPSDRAMMVEYFAKEVLGQGKIFDRVYRIVRHADQVMRWVNGLGKLSLDNQGRPIKMIGTIQDITERKQAADVLSQQMDELKRWQAVMLGREDRINDLKREVNALAVRLGQPPPYGTPEGIG
ncbi:MAG: PAS domain S-box protein [bacterium]